MAALQSFKDKTLYICFSGVPKGYAIRSLSGNTLIDQYQTSPPLKEVWSYMDDSAITFDGCGRLGSNVYFVGGFHGDYRFYGENPASLRDSSKYVVGYNTVDSSISFVPNMTVKPVPTVFAFGENLYVLSDPNDEIVPEWPFEVCNLSTKSKSKSWEQLPLPPFFDQESKYCDAYVRNARIGYVLIGQSFCVSNSKAAFKFDTEKKIWEPCMLFQKDDDDDDAHPDPCGPPFHFYGQAVLFDNDTLICMHSPEDKKKMVSNVVVAYKMVDGKVARFQSFSSQGLTPSLNLITICIAHFGHGFFGLVYTEYDNGATYDLNVKLFRLNKKEEEDEEGFLHCELLNQFKYNMDVQLWNPISFFVQ